MSTVWYLHLIRNDGGSLEEPFSDTTGYHFSIRNRDVMVLTGMVTVPIVLEKKEEEDCISHQSGR